MRETRKSGSEGGVGFNPPFLPLSFKGAQAGCPVLKLDDIRDYTLRRCQVAGKMHQ